MRTAFEKATVSKTKFVSTHIPYALLSTHLAAVVFEEGRGAQLTWNRMNSDKKALTWNGSEGKLDVPHAMLHKKHTLYAVDVIGIVPSC